jgi:acyl-CoA thioester hydrolase
MSGADGPVAGLVEMTPRPHRSRLLLALYPVAGTVRARYGDMDANGHLNNLALESLHENARAVMNSKAFPGVYDRDSRQLRLVTSQNVVHFLAESHWPATIDTGVGVGRIGRTSFVASSALFIGGACISVCDAVLVAVSDGGPIPIPEHSRNALSLFALRGH